MDEVKAAADERQQSVQSRSGGKMTSTITNMDFESYNAHIEEMRVKEYPMLEDELYLDHAGATLHSKTAMNRFHADMMANIYGNPHSASPSSQRSTLEIEAIRMAALQYFHADPDVFDLVFTVNTTAAVKLVLDAIRNQDDIFTYGYHVDSHTSLVGVREGANRNRCFDSDDEFMHFIQHGSKGRDELRLASWPAQSNMNGRRLPLEWSRVGRSQSDKRTYTLLDAAAYAATAPLSLGDSSCAADFTVLSFAKIFGFPDLGALIVKRDCAHLFASRRYFGGGTVDTVVCLKETWHASKSGSIHVQLEDGTLPVHSILALKSAMQTHQELFSSLDHVARHTAELAKQLYSGLLQLRHANGKAACRIYSHVCSSYDDLKSQGPSIAFNFCDSRGRWVSNSEVEKLASIHGIHIRTGGLCNPGGIAKYLDLSPWEIRDNFSAGYRCGGEDDIMNSKPTGVIRVSLGAMSVQRDIHRFLAFTNEFFVDKSCSSCSPPSPTPLPDKSPSRFFIESLTVYPIKSCGGWQVPHGVPWDIRREGLAWDREWCIVSIGPGVALSQKNHPRMALIRPYLDFAKGTLTITARASSNQISIPLSRDPSHFDSPYHLKSCSATVCNDKIEAKVYTSAIIADFLTKAVGIPCTLARFPAANSISPSIRHSKAHLAPRDAIDTPRPILLSNESPILTISRSSLNHLNETIKLKEGKAAHPAVFRANIILAESPLLSPRQEQPWAEDQWEAMQVGETKLDFLGGCRRCQMVCVDQESGEKNQEPFTTLAKTRRFAGGRVLFGVHTALAGGEESSGATITAGQSVITWNKVEKEY